MQNSALQGPLATTLNEKTSGRNLRKWLLNLHLYGGLLCAPYLIIFGFSSLNFNHHFGFVAHTSPAVEWQAPLVVESQKENDALATSVRDALGLMGWTIPWNMKRDASGDLQFDLERPGKSYTIKTQLAEHKALVKEKSKGFWQVLDSLHALGEIPNSKLAPFWGIYTEICTWFVIFAGISGIYLWANSGRERRSGLFVAVAAAAASVALILFVILRG